MTRHLCSYHSSHMRSSLLLVFILGSTSNLYGISYIEAVLNDNPDGYWAFQDGPAGPADGQPAISFGSGVGFDGTHVGGERVDAQLIELADGRVADLGDGNLALAVGFGGGEDFMSGPQSILSDVDAFTISGWVNPGPRNTGRIGLFGQNDVIEFGFISPDTIQLWTPVNQVVNYAIDPNLIQDNKWFHVAAVGTGESAQLFINGERVSGPPGPTGYGQSNFPFNIAGGGVFDTSGNQYTGNIDEVAVYNTALTDEQILIKASSPESYAELVLSDDPDAGLGVLPIGYWGFEDEGGIAVNRGTSGPLLNGTYVGVTPSTGGPIGAFPEGNKSIEVNALAGDGYVTIDANPLSNLTEFTISGWIAPGDQMGNTRVGIFGQNDAIEFGLIDPETLQIWTPGGGALNVATAGEIVPNEWNHVAAVGTGEELRFFINGELVGTGGNALQIGGVDSYGDSGDFFNVGGGGIFDNAGNQFTGIIDDVAVWDLALTEAQILAQFSAAFPAPDVPGDANGDGKVDVTDLNVVGLNWQMAVDPGAANGDFDGSGFVDVGDLNILALNWQFGVGEAAINTVVPEPGSQMLLLILLLLGPWARRKVTSNS